jgi:Asp-tRNA(Asn)/Glu-tRNA(Gln) amidotransferase A subunit family amidase
MPLSEELAFLDATAQAELVREKQVKPVELVEAAIERIERLNPTLNAVILPMYEQAREAAAGDLPAGGCGRPREQRSPRTSSPTATASSSCGRSGRG